MKKHLNNDRGFALITAVLMLFAATVLGIMVMNSSEIEVLLSGAQQRYEQSFNMTENASNKEAIILDKKQTIDGRSYRVTRPSVQGLVVSPTDATTVNFDPEGYIVPPADTTGLTDSDVATWRDFPERYWPADDVLEDDASTAYRYLVVYNKWDTVRKGYDSSNKGEMAEFVFDVDVINWNVSNASFNARIETGNSYMGPKPSLVME